MARSGKLNASPKVESAEALLEAILSEVIKAASMSFAEWWALSETPLVPLAIPVDAQTQYRVTQAGVDAAHKLTDQVWRKRLDLQQTISRSEFDQLSFRAIGETILNSKSHLPDDNPDEQVDRSFFVALVKDYENKLDQLANRVRVTVDRHIPCHLFHSDQGVPSFAVGPVTFLPREEWIERYVQSPEQLQYVSRVRRKEISYEELRERAFAQNGDRNSYAAWQVLNSLGAFEWVASIRMEGHELSQSHKKASILVGLAIDAIGLRFQADDARRFAKAGRQHLYSESRLVSSTEGNFLGGNSVQMPGLAGAPGALVKKLKAEQPFLDAAGKILQTYFDGRQTGAAPHMVERWVNALYWVGEARRETSDFMAVVNYGCAADGLSNAGGLATEMVAFAQAALNPKRSPNPPNSVSIGDAVTKVYREGRNKLAHGEMSGLLEDLSEARLVGDALLLGLFDAVTFELAAIIEEKPEALGLDVHHAYRYLKAKLAARQ